MLISPSSSGRDVATPNWRYLSAAEFRARVIELLPEATNCALTVSDEFLDEMVKAAFEYEIGPYDTACEIIDQIYDRAGLIEIEQDIVLGVLVDRAADDDVAVPTTVDIVTNLYWAGGVSIAVYACLAFKAFCGDFSGQEAATDCYDVFTPERIALRD